MKNLFYAGLILALGTFQVSALRALPEQENNDDMLRKTITYLLWQRAAEINPSDDKDQLERIKELLAAGADGNQMVTLQRIKYPLLNYALKMDGYDIAQLLLDADVEVNKTNERNLTPLHEELAKVDVNVDMVHRLLEAGADVNVQDEPGKQTPLMLFLSSPHGLETEYEHIVQKFMGQDITYTYDTYFNLVPCDVKLYVKKFAFQLPVLDLNLKDKRGKTVLDIATEEFASYKARQQPEAAIYKKVIKLLRNEK